ncbi:hypothetical protein [Microbacterium gilvum]|uniref:HTTM-like domain-containing protein n=1 Tax=Microbacterium gilvum TaxID=1336204 RepID=A0ABP9A5W5_9MICO
MTAAGSAPGAGRVLGAPRVLGRFAGRGAALLVAGLARIAGEVFAAGEAWLVDRRHALTGLAVARILLAVASLGTLLTDIASRGYARGAASAWTGDPFLGDAPLALLFLIGGVAAAAALLGWRTRIAVPVLVVVLTVLAGFGRTAAAPVDDPLRIALLWLAFADSGARLSLDARRRAVAPSAASRLVRIVQGEPFAPAWLANTVHNLAVVLIAAQLCLLSTAAGLHQAGGAAWRDGTAIAAFLYTPLFQTSPWLSDVLTAWAPGVMVATWGLLLLQVAFPFLLLSAATRPLAIALAIVSLAVVGVAMALPWYALAVLATIAVFVPDDAYSAFGRGAAALWRASGGRGDAAPAGSSPPAATAGSVAEESAAAPVPTSRRARRESAGL